MSELPRLVLPCGKRLTFDLLHRHSLARRNRLTEPNVGALLLRLRHCKDAEKHEENRTSSRHPDLPAAPGFVAIFRARRTPSALRNPCRRRTSPSRLPETCAP